MNILLSAVVFVLVFSVLIFIHELGHFAAAKKAGVKVEEFGFGLPPRLWGVKKGETIYSINWIPFGGFVRMLGEDPSEKAAHNNARSILNQSLRSQAFIVSAGVLMNLLLAFLLLTLGFWIGMEPLLVDEEDFLNSVKKGLVEVTPVETEGEALYLPRFVYQDSPDAVFQPFLENGDILLEVNQRPIFSEADLMEALPSQELTELLIYRNGEGLLNITPEDALFMPQGPLVQFVEPESPAELAGFQSGDQILSLNGQTINGAETLVTLTGELEPGSLVNYEVKREGEVLELSAPLSTEGRIGVGLANFVPYYGNLSLYSWAVPHELLATHPLQYGFFEAPLVAVGEMWRLGKATAVMFVNVLGNFLTFEEIPAGVSGPVGIAKMTFVSVQEGFSAVIRLLALLSLSLGVINILPLPALDGGHLFFILFEAITGRKPNHQFRAWVHGTGLILLLLFITYITVNDVMNLF